MFPFFLQKTSFGGHLHPIIYFYYRSEFTIMYDKETLILKAQTFLHLGVGEGEFNSEENLKHYLAMAYAKVTLHDCEADTKLMGCIILFPAPLSRSFAPKYTGQ